MATLRQKRTAKRLLQELSSPNPSSAAEVLKNEGYGKSLQNHPKRVLESAGMKEALRELGLTEELITTALVEDIEKKPQNRIRELQLGAEILGMKQLETNPASGESGNTYNFIFSQPVQEKVKIIDAEIKEMLTNAQEN